MSVPDERPAETTGVPATNITKVGLCADMTIDEKPVAIEGLVGGDFFLQLTEPATLGTPISFCYWLADKYKVKNLDIMLPYKGESADPDEAIREGAKRFKGQYKNYQAQADKQRHQLLTDIKENFKGQHIPEQVHEILSTACLAEVTITDLLIDIKKGETPANDKTKMKFGLSVGFTKPLDLLPGIEVNKLSILVMNAPKDDFTFPKRAELPKIELLPIEPAKATGYIEFKKAAPAANDTITLGSDEWTFVAGTPSGKQVKFADNIDGTLNNLAAVLNGAETGDTAKCTYKVNPQEERLEISYRQVGVAGNDFRIQASNAEVSGPTLSGGVLGTTAKLPPPLARGSITFKSVPKGDNKITVNGVVWTFATDKQEAQLAATESLILEDIPKTVAKLAERLNKSDANKINICEYSADDKVLTITEKETGGGKNFAFSVDPATLAEIGGGRLT
jgi:hypothetical protein